MGLGRSLRGGSSISSGSNLLISRNSAKSSAIVGLGLLNTDITFGLSSGCMVIRT